jgi:hypothetical protein
MTAFALGIAVTPQPHYLYATLGLLAWLLVNMAGTLQNIVSDRIEDEVNYPERTELVARVTVPSLIRWIRLTSASYIVTVLLLVTFGLADRPLWLRAPLAALWLVTLPIALQYSIGLRFNRRTVGQPAYLACLWPYCFLLGWAGGYTTEVGILSDLPQAVVTAALMYGVAFSLLSYKDARDVEGDSLVGYRSLYQVLSATRRPLVRAMLAVFLPFAGSAAAAAGFDKGWSGLAPLAALPLATVFALGLARAETLSERTAIRELGNWYWLTATPLMVYALWPESMVLALGAAGLAWYLACSRWAHCDPGLLTRDIFRDLIAVTTRRREGARVSVTR